MDKKQLLIDLAALAEKHGFLPVGLGQFLVNLIYESDRGTVLLVLSMIDEILEDALRAKFNIDSGADGKSMDSLFNKGKLPPLQPVAIKTRLAFFLGLIDDWTQKGLDEIRNLRNSFAHKWTVAELTMPNVEPIIAKLTEEERQNLANTVKAFKDSKVDFGSEAKLSFLLASGMIVVRLKHPRVDKKPVPNNPDHPDRGPDAQNDSDEAMTEKV